MVSKIVNIDVLGHKVMFVCNHRNTRCGFAHDADLLVDGRWTGDATCHYLNRTWERWGFESVCLSACSGVIDKRKASLKESYKDDHKLSRLAGKHKEAYEALCAADEKIVLMKAVKDELSKNLY